MPTVTELHHPFETPPAPGTRRRVADGIDWVRQPLPFALDHVNCWLLGAAGGPEEPIGAEATLVDTGVASEEGRALWRRALGGGRPARLLVTHFHPDHMGLAGEFADEAEVGVDGSGGAELFGSAVEVALARRVWHAGGEGQEAHYGDWYAANGLPPEAVDRARARGNGYRRLVVEPPPPARWRTLSAGEEVVFGERRFRVLVGRGHAPDMLMLHDPAAGILIAADQVLPSISPNVSILPLSPDPAPLASFLASLEALRELPADTLVLPSHGLPFRGLHARLDALAAHHDERLAALHAATAEPRTAFELFPVLFRRELDDQQLSFALGETLAHLAHEGRFERMDGEGGLTRWRHAR